MNHDEFIKELKTFGIDVRWVSDGDSGWNLMLNEIVCDAKNLRPFGFYCGGAYAPMARTKQNSFSSNDIKKAIKAFIDQAAKGALQEVGNVYWHEIKAFLREKSESARTKVLKESILRVLGLFDNYAYNTILRKRNPS